jgi:hypothetical protein
MSTESRAIIYVCRDRLYFYAPELPQVLVMAYTTASVADMEMLNKEVFNKQIQTFVTTNNLQTFHPYVIINNELIFQKVIRQQQKEQKEELTNAFFSNVPFERIAFIQYEAEDTSYLFAMNEDILKAIRHAFELKGTQITLAVPDIMIPNFVVSSQTGFTAENGAYLIQSIETFKQYNFINIQLEQTKKAKADQKMQKTSPRRVQALGGVFGVLILILVTLLVTNRQSVSPGAKASTVPSPVIAAPTPLVVSPVPVASPEASLKTSLNIDIQSTQPASSASAQIRTQLILLGYTQITTSVAPAVPVKNTISYSSKVSEPIRQEINTSIQSLFPDVSVQTVVGPQSDIIIQLKGGL